MSCYRMLSLALGLLESLFTETFTAPGDENLFEGTTMCTSFVKSNMWTKQSSHAVSADPEETRLTQALIYQNFCSTGNLCNHNVGLFRRE